MRHEAIDWILQWTKYLLIILPFAAGFMVAYFAIKKSFAADQDTIDEGNKRIWTTIKGAIIIESIAGVIAVIKSFYV